MPDTSSVESQRPASSQGLSFNRSTDKENELSVSPTQDAIIRKKFDYRILPIICVLYILSYLDRGNIGNAKTAGLMKDLHMSSYQFSWVLNSFYIAYILFEWTTVFWKLFPAHIYVAALCVLWGATAMSTGSVQTTAQVIACRILLGIFEAAFGAGAPYFLSLFYHRKELGFRVSLLLGMSPVANCFASAMAYGITRIGEGAWRYLLIIEGAPTVLFSIVVFFFLPDSPGNAKFLNEDEQTHAVERLQMVDRTTRNELDWRQVLSALMDYKNYIHMLIHFCCNYSFAGLSNFLPTIIRDMGYDSVNAQGLTAPPYLASFLCCVGAAILSDRLGKRGFIVCFFATIGTVGYLILTIVRDESAMAARYAGVWLATCGIFPALAINMTWLLSNQGGDSKRGAGMAILAIFGQCSSFISSVIFSDQDSPFYVRGCAVGCVFTGLIVVLALGLHFALKYQNMKKDRLYGPPDPSARVDVTTGGDNAQDFRYMT